MKLIRISLILVISTFYIALSGQELPDYQRLSKELSPIELAKMVADNIVDHTRFTYEYTVQPLYPDIEAIDFGRSVSSSKPGVAYALSSLFSEVDQSETIEIGTSTPTNIWVNDSLVFTQNDYTELPVVFGEKTYSLPKSFVVNLHKGENKILIKSFQSPEGSWLVLLQSNNLGRFAEKGKKITASLKNYAPGINLANWLVLGTFEAPKKNSLNTPFEPEKEIVLHKVYHSGGRTFAWDIPRVHINSSNPDGGKFYNWSYHVGGFIWGLQRLSQETGNSKYADFAANWCEYSLNTMPLAEYQVKELHAVRSMNWSVAERPMLDFTTAPSLPFITRLVDEKKFTLRDEYKTHAEKTMEYIINKQFRLANGMFARQHPVPTVWADDMFMGIPYLLFSAEYTNSTELRQKLYDDAANQVVQFNKLLFKNEQQLYRQACYVDSSEVKVPFWSRGNGWAIWGTSEVLLHLPKNHNQYQAILKIFREHINGIVRSQDRDGYWHNILDMPETVRESSGTAIFTLCIARGINNGWLDKDTYLPIVMIGWAALKSFVDQDGNLYGVKGGTSFSTNPEDYAKTPFIKSDTHGILPLLFACMEVNQLLEKVQQNN